MKISLTLLWLMLIVSCEVDPIQPINPPDGTSVVEMRTSYTEDWDSWRFDINGTAVSVRTSFTEDWDNWDIDDNYSSWHADVRTSFSEDFDDWDIILSEGSLSAGTTFSNDFDRWSVAGSFPEDLQLSFRIATLFVPVITAVMIENELIIP